MNQTPQAPFLAKARGKRIAVIRAAWHADIVGRARSSLLAELHAAGLPPEQVAEHEVPGAFEIPLLAQQLARRGDTEAIVAIAFVVDGGIYRHEFVASAVIDGLMRVQLDTGVPIFSAVLTPHHFHDHEDHRRFYGQHFEVKGREVASACLRVLARELLAA